MAGHGKPRYEMWSALAQAAGRDLDEQTVEAFIATSDTIRRSIIDRHRTARGDGPSPAGLF